VLRATRRILRPGGRTAFSTLVVAAGLSKAEHRRAVRWGPRAIASTRPLDELVSDAGFVDVEVIDVTEDFHSTASAWVVEWTHHEDGLRPILGELLDERRTHHEEMIAGVDQGLLQRLLITATA
jgi:hypothetical protein